MAGVLRAAVLGAGAFGKNHLRVYRELELAGAGVQLAAVVDQDEPAAAAAAERYGVPAFASIEAMLAAEHDIRVASVCVPTVHHAQVAETLLQAGVDLLVEKPLAATVAEADRIVALTRKLGRVVQTGHLERFNPAVTAAREHLNRPMFFEAHRLSVFTARSLDVDVVLDLMIHDLDIVMSLAGAEAANAVREVRAVGLPVLSGKVDIANVRLEFENGCIANFTASRVSTERVRKLRFFQPHQYLSLDFARQDLLMIDVRGAASLDQRQLSLMVAEMTSPRPGEHPSAGLSLRKLPVREGEPLRLEIEGFLDSVRGARPPLVSAEDGRAALALALEINRAIEAHGKRSGLASSTESKTG